MEVFQLKTWFPLPIISSLGQPTGSLHLIMIVPSRQQRVVTCMLLHTYQPSVFSGVAWWISTCRSSISSWTPSISHRGSRRSAASSRVWLRSCLRLRAGNHMVPYLPRYSSARRHALEPSVSLHLTNDAICSSSRVQKRKSRRATKRFATVHSRLDVCEAELCQSHWNLHSTCRRVYQIRFQEFSITSQRCPSLPLWACQLLIGFSISACAFPFVLCDGVSHSWHRLPSIRGLYLFVFVGGNITLSFFHEWPTPWFAPNKTPKQN